MGESILSNQWLSVIIPYTMGDDTRQSALCHLMGCIKRQTFKNYELILAEVVCDPVLGMACCRGDNHIILRQPRPFNKSWCVNVAVRQSQFDRILVLDADIQFEEDYFQKIFDFSQDNKNELFFNGFSSVRLQKGRDNLEERIGYPTDIKAAAISWYATKSFFWSIGGMNEKYYGYGAEDQDIWERARYKMNYYNTVPSMPYEIIHTYHHWHPKESNFPLNERRVYLLNETLKDVNAEIERLKTNLGGQEEPLYYNGK